MRQVGGPLLAAVILALAVGTAGGQVDVTKVGPQVGDQAPTVSLIDHRGRPQTLASLAGPKGTMLLFFRSADW